MHNQVVHILEPAETNTEKWAFDPPITIKGAMQASEMIEKLSMKAPTLVLVPPLKCCMWTALRAFHPDFNNTLRRIASKSATEDMDDNAIMQHFAKGNVSFMLDPRLQDEVSMWRFDERNGRIGLPSRREMHPIFKNYFIFPDEFYSKDSEGQSDDPDKDQDWYKKEGMWAPGFRSVECLERAASFKEFLYNRPEKEIIVITYYSFINTLIDQHHRDWNKTGGSCIWKPTSSGRMRLVPLTSPQSQKDILEDVDYSDYWPYRLCGRSEIFNKWHREPLRKILQILVGFEERKKYLGLEELTFESLEAELGPEVVQKVKDSVRGGGFYRL